MAAVLKHYGDNSLSYYETATGSLGQAAWAALSDQYSRRIKSVLNHSYASKAEFFQAWATAGGVVSAITDIGAVPCVWTLSGGATGYPVLGYTIADGTAAAIRLSISYSAGE